MRFGKMIVVAVVAVLLAWRGPEAQAFSNSIVGSTCVPDEGYVNNANYSGGTVSFAGSATGDIYLHCPVDAFGVYSHYLMSAGDGDTTGYSYYTQVQFRRMSHATGATTYYASTFSDQSSYEKKYHYLNIVSTSNYSHYYFVRLHRTGTSGNPRFYGITYSP